MGLNSADSHSYLQRETTQRENPSVVKFLRLKEKSSPLFICKETKKPEGSIERDNGFRHGENADYEVLTDLKC